MLQNYFNFVVLILNMSLRINWDFLGIATSLGCAIHCAILPLVLSSLPLFGINIIHNSVFEWGMIALAFVVGCISLVHGYLKHHRSFVPITVFLTGFIFLILKQFFPAEEYYFLTTAVLLIVGAHLLNYFYCSQSKTCSSPHHKH